MIKRKCLKEEASIVWNDRIEERRLQILKKRLLMKEQILEEIRDCDLPLSGGKRKTQSLEKTITKFVKKYGLLPLMQEEYLIPSDVTAGETDAEMLKSVFNQNKFKEEDWYILYRPQGKRVLVISNNSHTYLVEMRAKDDNLFIKKYTSVLQSIGGRCQSYTILDGILYENNNEKKVYILDLIAWNGHYFSSNPAEFRFYWLCQKWKEDLDDEMSTQDQNFIDMEICERISLTNYFICSFNLSSFVTDGLYLYHKDGDYTNDTSPFLLVFRTLNNCHYLKELMQSGIFTFKMMYERHNSSATVKIGQLEINISSIPHINTKSIVKVKLRLKPNVMVEEEIQPDYFEVISVEEDLPFKVIGKEADEQYCDTFGKLLYYLSIQNLQNDVMII